MVRKVWHSVRLRDHVFIVSVKELMITKIKCFVASRLHGLHFQVRCQFNTDSTP